MSVSINVPAAPPQAALVRAAGAVTEGTIGASGTATAPSAHNFTEVWAKIYPPATPTANIDLTPPGDATKGNPILNNSHWEFRLNDALSGVDPTEIPGVQVNANSTVSNMLVVWAKFVSIEIKPRIELGVADSYGRAMVTFNAEKSDHTDLDPLYLR